MFARVITAQAGPQGFGSFIRVVREQLPAGRQQPGFKAYYLLTDAESGKIIIISLWETREQMEAVGAGRPAGIQEQALPATGLTQPHLETYEVTMHACATALPLRLAPRRAWLPLLLSSVLNAVALALVFTRSWAGSYRRPGHRG